MRRISTVVGVVALVAGLGVSHAAAEPGVGDLRASFQAALTGGQAYEIHNDIAAGVAAPQVSLPGRITPFGAPRNVCDEAVVGSWVFWLFATKAEAELVTNEFALDGEALDVEQTALKRIPQGDAQGLYGFAVGAPVLGTLDPGDHTLTWTFDDGAGFSATIDTPINVDAAHC